MPVSLEHYIVLTLSQV